jgi:hypothetical protein
MFLLWSKVKRSKVTYFQLSTPTFDLQFSQRFNKTSVSFGLPTLMRILISQPRLVEVADEDSEFLRQLCFQLGGITSVHLAEDESSIA